MLIDDGTGDQSSTNSYQRTNSNYAILYAFEPDWGWLQKRQNQLDNYRQQGLADTSRQIVTETLNVMGLNWMLQTEAADEMLSQQLSDMPQWHHRAGRMAQETGKGYYIDVYAELSGEFQSGGNDAASVDRADREFTLFTTFGSALEYGIIEQLQNSSLVGASTVKMLQIANANGQAIYMASSTNWLAGAKVSTNIVNYDSTTKSTIGDYIANGYVVLLPQNGSNHVAGTGSWAGYGYQAELNSPTMQDSKMIISGGYSGGYVSVPGASPSYDYVALSGDSQPQYFGSVPIATPNPTGADPVDMADGTFQIEHTDLSLGQGEPRGITLTRYYNGTRRNSNAAGMADGWIHNYAVNVNTIAAPQAGFGGTTPAQAAPMLAATCAAIGIFNDLQPDPKNWMVTLLIAKWGVDQLSKNGVSVNLGKDTVQFVQQPNGIFTPPANCTMTLAQNGSTYSLQQRHGNKFNFDSLGRLVSLVDQYGQSLGVSYINSTSSLPQTVTDWKSRTFTFNYASGRLSSVNDSAGRSVAYGYSTAYNSQGDLTSFTDPEGKTGRYAYDGNHDVTETFDAKGQLVISNAYDSFGHVATQYTQADTNKTWRIFWSGWQTIEQDPMGGQRAFSFDDQGRLISVKDQLGNLSQSFYDGQNHVVTNTSPLNETFRFIYDGNNNLVQTIDPLYFTNQFFYDSQNRLYRSIDARGNPSNFGYNSQFSLTGQTNGAGDFVSYAYNSDGTLYSRTDVGGTTINGYDSYGQLNSITYPNSLGSESFVNSSLGEVTSHTDARGFVTSFQYNNRLELTNTIAPTNLTISVSFDPADNVASTTDARHNSTTNSWSATRHLLTTTLPPVAAGTPVWTRAYDNRDWLTETLDPLQAPTFYTNNPAGWLVLQIDPLLNRTNSFGFDADGHQLAATNASHEVTRQTWDARSKLIALTDGAQHTSLRAFDGAGNQVILTNRNSKVWQFQFDGANRLTNTTTPLLRHMSQTWNHQGLLSTVTDPSNQVTYLYYDGKGRLTNRNDAVGTVLYGFDASDNRTSVSGNGLTNTWSYDAYNRVSTYKDASGNLIQYRWDANGNLTNLVYPGGRNVYYTFDNDNHLTQVKDWSGRITTLTYDLAGRLLSVTRPNATFRTLGYDSAGELTNIWEQMPNGLPIAWLRHNWNPNATMNCEFAAPLPHNNAPPSRTMTYNDDNELSTVDGLNVTVDLDGNLTYGPLTNDTFSSYTFDVRNRLLNAGGVTNFYDAANNRIGQSYGTNSIAYVVDPNAKLSQVLMRIKNGVTNYYIYGEGLLYQVTESVTATNTLTYHYDSRGSTIALTDDGGNVRDRFEYSLYATLTYRAGTDDTPFLFNGRYGVMTDPSGLLYMRARYYNSYICRFISADPSGFAGGFNFYAFCNGNPISLEDPFGLGYWSDVGQVWVGYGQAGVGTVTGLYNAAAHPINTLGGLYNAASSPVQTYNAISTSVANTWNSGLQGQGQIVGNILIAAATIGSGAATASTRAAEIVAAEPGFGVLATDTAGMSQAQILAKWEAGSMALNGADYEALGGNASSALFKAPYITDWVDTAGSPLTTTPWENFTQSLKLAKTGLTPGAAFGAGVLGTGAESVGWLGNASSTQSSSTGK